MRRDEHDAEIARLRAALAAGPAALREAAKEANEKGYGTSGMWLSAADVVRYAQQRAMEEE